jgi:glycosyltransferase involved in cell wall biosynthesis
VKVIYTAHGFLFHPGLGFLRNYPLILAERLAGRWTDYLIVINDEDARAARRYRLVPDDCLRLMPGVGLSVDAYASKVSRSAIDEAKSTAGLGPDTPYFLCVAEFRPVKRHDDVLTGFASVVRHPRCADVALVLAGDGPLREKAMRKAERLGIAHRTHFVGFRQDVNVLLAGARALVLASEREGMPRCVLEAMAARVPVIATHVRGTSELLANGKGTLVPVRAPDALGGAMRDVLLEPERFARSVQEAFRSVRDFELARVLAMHEALYAEALSLRSVNSGALAVGT